MTSIAQLQMIEKIEPAGLQFPIVLTPFGVIENQDAWDLFAIWLRQICEGYRAQRHTIERLEAELEDARRELKLLATPRISEDISWIQEHDSDEAYERNE